MKPQSTFYSISVVFFLMFGVLPLRSDDFEGIYKVGNDDCRVKPIRMAFEVFCKKTKKKEIYFYQGEENNNVIFKTDDGDLSTRFIFDDSSLKSGVFIGIGGSSLKVKKK
ncbi:hypothetical protein [Leptospira adleri]|uniref:Uncharacterized protein n=1 Tax=Leptospira adleri TaxID=2023186 RepID=A0A2M9YIM5_9LEPT|nr:hypothetical protein [Leptospira adleri]PJZ51378.1 hypothetical protein CH380_20475 [Leptospira adleri]PJZ60440.1 hypothetical protein CH376_18480 [Leptospira adleri]